MERMPEAEWGANPREWVTVMRARRAQSDTSEPDLCSCRHRESMDEFFVRTAGGCADFLSGAFPPPESAVRKAAQPMCFPGSLRRSPSAACCQTKPPPALGTAEGGFSCDEKNDMKSYARQREPAVSRRICCICGHCASMSAASRSCARQRSRFCVGRSILK